MTIKKEDVIDGPEVIQNLKALIENGTITTITVDTTAFDDNGMRLDRGLFSQLRQFGRHPVDFVISEVVLSEIRRHLTKHLNAAKSRFSRDMIDACDFVGGVTAEVVELRRKLDEMPSAADSCERQIKSFIDDSAVKIIVADENIRVSELLKLYFESKPPFQNENPKKKEFPDAIALSSLEAWAQKTKRKIVVVSRDGDWDSFCKESEHLYLVKNLANALALFQTPAEIVQAMLEKLRSALNDKSTFIFESILKYIQNFDWHGHISVDAYSQFEYEEDEISVEIEECNFIDDAESIKLTETNDDNVSVAFDLEITGQVTVYCSFQKWDGIDKEYMPMGSGSSTAEFSLQVSVILNMPIMLGELSDFDFDIQPSPLHVELDNIEPDWMSSGD